MKNKINKGIINMLKQFGLNFKLGITFGITLGITKEKITSRLGIVIYYEFLKNLNIDS